jgi:23S rRNA (adenine2503-C2)-methyltransferase
MTAPHLRGSTPEDLVAAFGDVGLDLRSARRIVERMVARDEGSLGEVEGLSKRRREAVLARGRVDRLEILDRRASAVDPFVKYLFRAGDGKVFETVRIPLEKPRWSVCVSSQAGCAIGCAFCETGRLGLDRNLETWEIVEQVLAVRREGRERPVTSVVFQGQGEPFQNYDHVLRAAAIFRNPNGLKIRGEAVTISTVGILPAIERFTEEGHVHRLILSITSAFDAKREALIPTGRRWPVRDLAAAMRRHRERHGGVIHLAWVLIAGVNTGDDEARELELLFRGVPVRVHVIEVNDPTGRFRAPDDAERRRFLAALGERGMPFVRRYSGGPDIHAACGMLAATSRGGTSIA